MKNARCNLLFGIYSSPPSSFFSFLLFNAFASWFAWLPSNCAVSDAKNWSDTRVSNKYNNNDCTDDVMLREIEKTAGSQCCAAERMFFIISFSCVCVGNEGKPATNVLRFWASKRKCRSIENLDLEIWPFTPKSHQLKNNKCWETAGTSEWERERDEDGKGQCSSMPKLTLSSDRKLRHSHHYNNHIKYIANKTEKIVS